MYYVEPEIRPLSHYPSPTHGNANVSNGYLQAFDVFVKSNLRLVSVVLHPKGSPGPLCTCVFALTVTSPLCNRFGTLHGGATAYLIDICTTLALAPIAAPGFWGSAGVSRTLSATYLRPAPQGMEVRVVAEVVQAGRRTCSLRARVEDGQTGVWLSTGEHCKVENSDIKSVEGGSEKEERERDSMLIGRAKL